MAIIERFSGAAVATLHASLSIRCAVIISSEMQLTLYPRLADSINNSRLHPPGATRASSPTEEEIGPSRIIKGEKIQRTSRATRVDHEEIGKLSPRRAGRPTAHKLLIN